MRVVGAVCTILPVMAWFIVAVTTEKLPSATSVIGIVSIFVGGKIVQKPFEKD
jgi:hypothetical protein